MCCIFPLQEPQPLPPRQKHNHCELRAEGLLGNLQVNFVCFSSKGYSKQPIVQGRLPIYVSFMYFLPTPYTHQFPQSMCLKASGFR